MKGKFDTGDLDGATQTLDGREQERNGNESTGLLFHLSMTNMVWMPIQNRERAIDLFQQDYPRQLMRHGYFSQGYSHGCGLTSFLAEAVCGANSEHEGNGIILLMFSYEKGK